MQYLRNNCQWTGGDHVKLFKVLVTTVVATSIIYYITVLHNVSHPILQRTETSENSSNIRKQWDATQQKRLTRIKNACDKASPVEKERDLQMILTLDETVPRHIIVDDNYKILFCYIPKVACTNWKGLMMILSNKTEETEPDRISETLVHKHESLSFLDSFKVEDMMTKIKTYTKIIFVRNPYERIVSAYKDKLKENTEPSREFRKKFVSLHMPRDPINTDSANPVSFEAFARYLIEMDDPNRVSELNEHWAPYHSLCEPCLISYDIIGTEETIDDDAEHVLTLIGAPSDLHMPFQKKNTTSNVTAEYFFSVEENIRKALHHFLQKDCDLFGYENDIPVT